MHKKTLLDRKMFSLQFLVDLSMVTNIGQSIILFVGIIGDTEPTEALSKLALIKKELLRPPINGSAPLSEKKVDAIIEYLHDAIRAIQLSNAIADK